MEFTGKYATAKVYADTVEETAISQIYELLNQPFVQGSKIRIMPDVHAGAGCVIGFTADLGDLVIPNLVGVDIGCGMQTYKLEDKEIDFKRLDEVINTFIPAGRNIHGRKLESFKMLEYITCYKDLRNKEIFEPSLGTLGGGNHFIEIDVDDEGVYYLVIHSGSRNLGKQIADFHQNVAIEDCSPVGNIKEASEKLVAQLKAKGRHKDISKELSKLKNNARGTTYPKDLCFVTGEHRDNYLNDMEIAQFYARTNRISMGSIIIDNMGFSPSETFETVHNYIDFKSGIMRKGAVSAKEGETLLIPMNMRDGSLLCVGKGNADWNFSAPHGAGRLMSRGEAKRTVRMDDYTETMKGIYSTSVTENTLDESPFAYKPMEDIISAIGETASIVKRIKPVYNFKAGD